MKKALCPITKKVMECKSCALPEEGFCPYIEFDKLVERTLKLLRGISENEKSVG